ncbi:hypothetical protein FQN52_004059 [Onygenales sp. PD_12]|nr:hypothetical protein FQN52_004059 [Onygenales sp. PD_12]
MANYGAQTSRYNRLVVIFVALGSLTYGYCCAVISSTLGHPGWYSYFNLPVADSPGYSTITTPVIATANGVFSAGGAIGSLFMMWSCDAFGRKANIQLGSFLAILGGALQGGAVSLNMFQAGRFVSGTAIGVLVTVCPMYLAEMSSPFVRGKFDEAYEVLKRIRHSSDDPYDVVAKEEFVQTKEQLKLEAAKLAETGHGVWTAVFKRKSYRKRMIIGFLTQWGAEFGGPLVINNYAVILYTNLGMTGHMPLLLIALWLTTAGLIYNPLGAWLHDKVNSRRWMFMTGFIGIVVTTSCLAAMSAEYGHTKNRVGNGLGIFFIFLYLAFQGTFCDTTMYLYVSEIFPTEIRPIGMGFSLFGQFSSTLILLQTAPMGFVNVGWKYYLVIICWSAVFVPVIYFFFPETARLTLEEIAKNFGEEIAVAGTDATDEEKRAIDCKLRNADLVGSNTTNSRTDVDATGSI